MATEGGRKPIDGRAAAEPVKGATVKVAACLGCGGFPHGGAGGPLLCYEATIKTLRAEIESLRAQLVEKGKP